MPETKPKFRWLFTVPLALLALPIMALVEFALGRPDRLKRYLAGAHLMRPSTREGWENRFIRQMSAQTAFAGLTVPGVLKYGLLSKLGIKPMSDFIKEHIGQANENLGSNFFERVAAMEDRSLAIMTTSMLERYLGLAVMTRFGRLISKDDYNRIFGPNAPLASLSAKINLCHSLGILIGDMRNDLNLMRKIRNDFAHGITELSFSDKAVSDRCNQLKMHLNLVDKIKELARTPEREKFIASAMLCMINLAIVLVRNINVIKVMTEQNAEITRRTKDDLASAKLAVPQDAPTT